VTASEPGGQRAHPTAAGRRPAGDPRYVALAALTRVLRLEVDHLDDLVDSLDRCDLERLMGLALVLRFAIDRLEVETEAMGAGL
jgi:hypothetical protein